VLSIAVFVNDSLTPVEPQFRLTFELGNYVNGKQFGKKYRFAFGADYFIAFSGCPMRCYK
jgi:hypothetical protein